MDRDEHHDPLCWEEIPNDGSLNSFAQLNQLDPEQLASTEGLLLLPRNPELPTRTTGIEVFPSVTKELNTAFQDAGIESALYGEESTRRELVRKSADILLPILLFFSDPAAQLGLNILANWIYDRWVKSDTPTPSIKAEYAEVTSDGVVARWRRVEGPADQVCKLLQQESQALTTSRTSVPTLPEEGNNWWKEHSREQANAALTVASELILEANQQRSQANN